jgi:hypothetical protein
MFLPKIPEAMITAAYGEMGNIVLKGVRASNEKLRTAGFTFKYNHLEPALKDIYNKQ